MKSVISPIAVILVALLTLWSLPAASQAVSYQAEVDCDGVFAGGDAMPYLVTMQNNTLEPIALDVTIRVRAPGLGVFTVRSNFSLNLPAAAPNGEYIVNIVASSPTETSFDTCSFHVQ
jgi:hypothetical protein